MRICRNTLLFLTLFSLLAGCTIFKKSIHRPVKIKLDHASVQTRLSSTAWNTKYTYLTSEQQVLEAFLKGFATEAGYTKNVSLTENEAEADYVLKLTELNVSESSKTEKVNDVKSEFHGQEFVLNSVECTARMQLQCRKMPGKTYSCFGSRSRSEQLKNNRNATDLIFGTNKDRSNYRTRLLSDYVCTGVSEDAGRRIWVPITRKIAKTL